MRIGLKLLVLLLGWQMVPGMTEIVENIVHLAQNGHLAHAIDDAQHAPEGDEHGCSGTFHLCQCHSSASFLSFSIRVDMRELLYYSNALPRLTDDLGADGYLSAVFRPPIA